MLSDMLTDGENTKFLPSARGLTPLQTEMILYYNIFHLQPSQLDQDWWDTKN